VVTTGEVKPGDVLERGKAVFEIAAQQGFRFEGTVPSEEVGHLRVGMPVRIKLDAYDFQRYGVLTGTVSFIAPDSRAGEGAKPVQYLVAHRPGRRRGGARRVARPGEARMGGQAEIVNRPRESLPAARQARAAELQPELTDPELWTIAARSASEGIAARRASLGVARVAGGWWASLRKSQAREAVWWRRSTHPTGCASV